MPTRHIRVSFHRVDVTDGERRKSFGDILTEIEGIPNNRRRTKLVADEPVRLRRLDRVGRRWLGDLARIRLHETIDKSTIDGAEAEIRFEEDEGPCEKTAFFYDPDLRVMAIQQASGAVSASSCGRYFRTIGNVRKIELPIILKLEALEKILRFGFATKLQVKLAAIDNHKPLRNINVSARQMMQFVRSLNAPTASINLNLSRQETPVESVKQLVRDLLRLEEDRLAEVKKILVVGGDDGEGPDEMTAIDLVKDRMIESVAVALADGERITDAHRYRAVRTAWDQSLAELNELYGQE
jgi:hypothetical protein